MVLRSALMIAPVLVAVAHLSAWAQTKPSTDERDRRVVAPSFDILAMVSTFEPETFSKVIAVQGAIPHSECNDGRVTARIERQCFPPSYRPDATLFSVRTPSPLRNPFSAEETACFTATGGRITNITQNCFEGEVTIKQCAPRQSEECSWSLRNGTSYVAQVVAQRDVRPQVGSDLKTWRAVGRGTYEFTLAERSTISEFEYSYSVTVTNVVSGKTIEISNDNPSRDGVETEFDPRWRKLTVKVR